jgi:hypothetical protein
MNVKQSGEITVKSTQNKITYIKNKITEKKEKQN